MEIDIEDIDNLNKKFSELMGVKKIHSLVKNNDTNEVRYYAHRSGAYKKPKGWKNVTAIVLPKPIYPDFTKPSNFTKLLNIQWDIFRSLGPQYTKVMDEPFEVNYLVNKIQGIQVCRAFGGGELLDDYIKVVRNTEFEYDIMEDVLC